MAVHWASDRHLTLVGPHEAAEVHASDPRPQRVERAAQPELTALRFVASEAHVLDDLAVQAEPGTLSGDLLRVRKVGGQHVTDLLVHRLWENAAGEQGGMGCELRVEGLVVPRHRHT